MNLRAVMMATLAGLPACFGRCPRDPFEVDQELSREALWEMGIDAEWIGENPSCETMCQALLWEEGFSTVERWDACEMSFDAAAWAASDSGECGGDCDEVLGHITCEGRGAYDCKGRRPLGYREARVLAEDESVAAFARTAALESASVLAFEELVRELDALGAPAELLRRCARAAADERRHAAAFGVLARGARVLAPPPDPHAPRDRLALAIHNATEGCVFESWAALEARLDAGDAQDRGLRALFQAVAEDETRHGQLAWDLHVWLLGELPEASRALVRAAQRAALAELPKRVRPEVREVAERFAAALA